MKNGWNKQRLASVTVKITDGSHNPPKGVPESGYLMLSSKNVFDDNLHYEEPRYLTAEEFQQEDKRTRIVPGEPKALAPGRIPLVCPCPCRGSPSKKPGGPRLGNWVKRGKACATFFAAVRPSFTTGESREQK